MGAALASAGTGPGKCHLRWNRIEYCRHCSHFGSRYTLGSCCKAGLLPFYFFHVAIHGTVTQLRPKILLSPLCYFEGPRNKYLLAAHRLFKTYAAGWKNNKKNNSRSASFFLSSDLCSWVEEQEEKQQQVEHTGDRTNSRPKCKEFLLVTGLQAVSALQV